MVVTKEKICFAKPGSSTLLDYIPLEGILNVALSKQNRVGLMRSLSTSIRSLVIPPSPGTESGQSFNSSPAPHAPDPHDPAPHAPYDDAIGRGGNPKFSVRKGSPHIPSHSPDDFHLDGDHADSRDACVIIVKTEREGHNAGRTYQIRAQTLERAQELVKTLNKCVDEALDDEGDTWVTRYQRKAKAFYDSDMMQMAIALLIVSAFLLSIVR